MTRPRWKKCQPSSMSEAIHLCLEYAMHRHRRDVQRVADINGISKWVIYKWMSSGSIPSNRIAPFEFACDCHFVTEYLGHAAQKMLIDIPRGRNVSQDDLLDLQGQLNEAVSKLTGFYREGVDTAPVLAALSAAMSALASHRENVIRHDTPELPMFDETSI